MSQQQRGHDQGRANPLPTQLDPARMGLPTRPQTNAELVHDALLLAAAHGNLLAPTMKINRIPPGHEITFAVVQFSVQGLRTYERDGEEVASNQQSNGIWYATDGGLVALHRSALDMLAQAAGISWVYACCGRTDDRQTAGLWSYRMTCTYKGLDGVRREITREHELDLRDGSPAAAKAGRGLRNARNHGAQLCESKAASRCIRAALGIRAYSVTEAKRPFVLPVLHWVPDTSDPQIRRMIAAKELGLVQELYGQPAQMMQVIDEEQVIDHPEPAPPREAPRRPAPKALPAPPAVEEPSAEEELQRRRARQHTAQQRSDDPWERSAPPPDLGQDDPGYWESMGL